MRLKRNHRSALVVDDQDTISSNLKLMLEHLGFTNVHTAKNGEEAIALAEENNPDLILMDVILNNKMNGYETAQIIKQKSNANIIYITGCPSLEFVSKIIYDDPDSLILKPANFRELKDKIKKSFSKGKQ